MKIEINKPEVKSHDERKYPYIGYLRKNNTEEEFYVLFICKNTGTLLKSTLCYPIGHTLTSWSEEYFIKFEGKIVLEN